LLQFCFNNCFLSLWYTERIGIAVMFRTLVRKVLGSNFGRHSCYLDWIYVVSLSYIFFTFSHRMRVSPLGTAATVWPIVPAPDDRSWWLWSSRWNANWHGKQKYSEKNCPVATVYTTNPTSPDLGLNPGRCCGKPATNRLSYGTAFSLSSSMKWCDSTSIRPRPLPANRKPIRQSVNIF
jgi:hypothetical protein